MAKSVIGVLFELDDKARTLPVLLDRMGEIKGQLGKVAGVLKKMDKGKFERQPDFYLATIHGWANKLISLGNELVVIQTEIAKHLQ